MNKKIAYNIASNWDEYESQGPAYKELRNWWEQNFNKLPNGRNASYNSWTSWYFDKYNNEWRGQHRGPEFVIDLLKEEASGGKRTGLGEKIKERSSKVMNIFNNKEDETSSDKYKKPKSKRAFRWRNSLDIPAGVKLNITDATADFLDVLGEEARKMGAETPYITSAYRNYEDQGRAMAGKWRNNGGENGGLENFKAVYSPDTSYAFDKIFKMYGTGKEGAKMAAIEAKKRWPNPRGHGAGRSIDLRMTSDIDKVLNAVVNTGKINLKLVPEGDHYHVNIYSSTLT